MILHVDDRLLHGRILHGWNAASAARILLVSERLDDEVLRRAFRLSAEPARILFVRPVAGPIPAERKGDFWLSDSLSCVEAMLEGKASISVLKIIGLREGGEALGPDLSPSAESRSALDRLAGGGLPVFLQPFPGDRPRAWPPRPSNTP